MNFPISPLDGRYYPKVQELGPIFSEFGLAKARTRVEVEWLIFLSEKGIAPKLPSAVGDALQCVSTNFDKTHFQKIKDIEATTNHDVKAIELFLREYVPKSHWSWIHFACTSEDINNLSYGLILEEGRSVLIPEGEKILEALQTKAQQWKSVPMLCRTHGQTATPSTMGKEIAVFWNRTRVILESLEIISITGKINGATGTYSAHSIAFPDVDWISLSHEFVEDVLDLTWNPLTTQIESHDQQTAFLNEISSFSSVLIDLSRDIWGYVSLGYFGQKVIKGEVGSSTMPHKVNPIDFENAEGNFKLARGIARTLADELPISRWQRDLTDSTLQRNFGLVFGHFLLGLKSLQKGLGKLEIREDILKKDLENAPEVLTEAVQTVMRAHGHHDAYDQLKNFSRGKILSLEDIQTFIDSVDLPEAEKKKLKELTPAKYIGLSEKLVEDFVG